MDPRHERGRQLAQSLRIKHVGGATWQVPSQSQNRGSYLVNVEAATCTCPDYELRRTPCKHQYAVAIVTAEQGENDGPEDTRETVRVKRKTYPQDWPTYNAAQREEKEHVQELLRALCADIVTPPHPGRGPKPIPLADVVVAMAMKVYSTVSGRRVSTDIRACVDSGHLTRAPSYNALFDYFEKLSMTPLLTALVEESAAPLSCIERRFAIDSTGFGTSTYRRWYDEKYGGEKSEQLWIKAHAMVGVVTGAVTAVKVTDGTSNDCPELPALVATTRRRFTIDEVSADKAYLSHANLAAVEAAGAVPYVPFKLNSQGDGSPAWQRMWALFTYRQDEFLAHYHARSNVESVFSAIKRKFGAAVRSKHFIAQTNEVLCKCLVHNLAVLAHAMQSLGVEATFAAPRVQAVGT